ncbi:type II secretion system minor pseudopilin GspJ [Gammaproteobacteria bacterium]|nr:type II secretion system minor pseudopilin GspJ [Gammaproteobacteria bacterium]
MHSQRGFTLIELLVAISIFSIIGLASYQLLQTAIEGKNRITRSTENTLAIARAVDIMTSDFSQLVSRRIRNNYGEWLAPLIFEEGEYLVEFTRTGWINPSGKKRSTLQRVAYSFDYEEGTLTRLFWEVLDRAEESAPVEEIILRNVEECLIVPVLDDSVQVQSDSASYLPIAVEISIFIKSSPTVLRTVRLVENAPSSYVEGPEKGIENNAET